MMVLAAMSVIGEYRTGTMRTTFMATPSRIRVLAAKALITAVVAGVFAAVMAIVSIALVRAMAGEPSRRAADVREWGSVVRGRRGRRLRDLGRGPCGRARGSVAAHGRGHRRATAGALRDRATGGSAPRIGQHVGPLLPFVNAYAFTRVPWFAAFPPRWGALGSLLYFTAIVVVVFVIALVVISRRDP